MYMQKQMMENPSQLWSAYRSGVIYGEDIESRGLTPADFCLGWLAGWELTLR